MIRFITMILRNKILFSFLVLATVLLIVHNGTRPAGDNWRLAIPTPIATSAAFPHEYGGLTVLEKSIYISLENGVFYRLSPEGETFWSFPMQDYTIFPPQENGGITYITSFDGRVYALNTQTGDEVWRFTTPGYIKADTEPVVSDDLVYFGSRNGKLYALDRKTGEKRWSFQAQRTNPQQDNPNLPILHFGRFAIDQDTVFLNSATDQTLYALNKTNGKELWNSSRYEFAHRRPVIGDNTVSIQRANGQMATFDKQNGASLSQTIEVQTTPYYNNEFKNPQIDEQQTRSLNDDMYLITKDKKNIIKLHKADKNSNLKTIPQKKLLSPRHTSQKLPINDVSIKASASANQNEIYTITLEAAESSYMSSQTKNFQAEFTSPYGLTQKISSFYFDKNTWLVRWRPQEIGMWTWKIKSGDKELSQGTIEVNPSNMPGFLTLSPRNTKIFFEGTRPVFPVGLQDCFRDYNHDGSPLDQWFPGVASQPLQSTTITTIYTMDSYLDLYKQNGFSLWRYGVGNCSKPLWLEMSPTANRYNLNESFYVDTLFDALHRHNYHIWMSLLSFSLPFESQNISIADQEVMLKKYIEYIVARYAAYVDVWELTNEMHLSNELIEIMATYLRTIDPYKHPITTNWERPDHPAIEINSIHTYDSACDFDCIQNMVFQINKYKTIQKPAVLSEVGNIKANWDARSADRMRVRLWAGFFFDLVPIYWNSSKDVYSSNQGASNTYLGPWERAYTRIFSDTIGQTQDGKQIEIVTTTEHVTALGKKSGTIVLIYLYRNINALAATSAEIQLPTNARSLQWIDPKTGIVLQTEKKHLQTETITTPPFTTDLLLKASYN